MILLLLWRVYFDHSQTASVAFSFVVGLSNLIGTSYIVLIGGRYGHSGGNGCCGYGDNSNITLKRCSDSRRLRLFSTFLDEKNILILLPLLRRRKKWLVDYYQSGTWFVLTMEMMHKKEKKV